MNKHPFFNLTKEEHEQLKNILGTAIYCLKNLPKECGVGDEGLTNDQIESHQMSELDFKFVNAQYAYNNIKEALELLK